MFKSRGAGCLTYVVAFIAVLGGIVSWADFLFKPLTKTRLLETGGVAAVVGDLLRPVPTIYGWPLAGYVFFASSACLLIAATILFMRPVRRILNYLDTAEAPVSILESHIELYMEDIGFKHCRVTRTQKLHANQVGVEAFHYSTTSIKGSVDKANIDIKSRINNDHITRDTIKRVRGNNLEVIETFTKPLPTNRWITYLPDKWVLGLSSFGFFQNSLVDRRAITMEMDEYDGAEPLFQVTPAMYPATNITFSLNFPAITAPQDADVKSHLITSNVVQTVPVDAEAAPGGRKVFTARVKALNYKQSFRIEWVNDRLEHVRQTQPQLFVP